MVVLNMKTSEFHNIFGLLILPSLQHIVAAQHFSHWYCKHSTLPVL